MAGKILTEHFNLENFFKIDVYLKNNGYEAMYSYLSQEGEGRESQEEFTKKYEEYEAKGNQLVEYTLFPPIAGADGAVIVKVNMRFGKDMPPNIVSGVSRIDLVEEKGNLRIKEMHVPILPPELFMVPGSHPGGDY